MGDNSIFKQAQNAKVQTELGKIEERANLIYTDKLMQNVPDSLSNQPTMQEIVDQLETEGYKIEQVAVSGDAITGISLSRESMTLGFGGSNSIKVTLVGEDNNDGYTYYALVDGKYYQMHYNNGNITIDRTPSEMDDTGEKPTLSITNSDDTVATATLDSSTNIISITANNTNKAGTTTITVTYGSYTKTCSVMVKDIPITTTLEMNSVRARIAAGYTRWLGAITTPTDALQEFEWSSSDESIATVDNNGVVTAKKAGRSTIKVKTIDGSNKEGKCEVTVVETDKMVADLTDFQTENTVAKDENGNLITVPGDFKVLTSEGTKVTDGIVIQDREENEFVWVPVDSVSTGTSKIADDIRLGRYNFANDGTPGLKQDADDYGKVVETYGWGGNCFQELIDDSVNTAAKNLGDFITKTKNNGGFYLGRYEASKGVDDKAKSQLGKTAWGNITQPNAAIEARRAYENNYIESDLINSYTWDTAIVFIQKYSENKNYSIYTSKTNVTGSTGTLNDEVCNIHDMASNCFEWTTEHSTFTNTGVGFYFCTLRGEGHDGNICGPRSRRGAKNSSKYAQYSFRLIVYIK